MLRSLTTNLLLAQTLAAQRRQIAPFAQAFVELAFVTFQRA